MGLTTAQAFTEIHPYGFDQSQLYRDEGRRSARRPLIRGPR
jgi:hypothetical protein